MAALLAVGRYAYNSVVAFKVNLHHLSFKCAGLPLNIPLGVFNNNIHKPLPYDVSFSYG